jgi:hypothetical protein
MREMRFCYGFGQGGRSMSPDAPLPGLDPTITKREITFTVNADGVTPFLKIATASRNGEDAHTFVSDEGPHLGGLGSAPPPLAYFSAAIAF